MSTTTKAGELSLVTVFTTATAAHDHAREVGLVVFVRGKRSIAVTADAGEVFYLGGSGESRTWDRMRQVES